MKKCDRIFLMKPSIKAIRGKLVLSRPYSFNSQFPASFSAFCSNRARILTKLNFGAVKYASIIEG